MTGDYLRLRNAAEASRSSVDPAQLAELIRLVGDGAINRASAREVLDAHAATGDAVGAIVDAARACGQISDAGRARRRSSTRCIAANPDAVADVRAGKAQAIGFLVGQVMKATRGQANAAVAQAAIRERWTRRPGEPDGHRSTSC